jgi:hypothetical protein
MPPTNPVYYVQTTDVHAVVRVPPGPDILEVVDLGAGSRMQFNLACTLNDRGEGLVRAACRKDKHGIAPRFDLPMGMMLEYVGTES